MPTLLLAGAGPRLGGAIARRFARDGYDVALLSEHEGSVTALGEALQAEGITTGWAVADVGDSEALRAAVTRFGEHTGSVDVLVHNVSVWREASTLDLSPCDLLADVHAGAASLLTSARAAVPFMPSGGAVIATGSAAADFPSPGAPTLGVQKAALRALVQAMAPDYAERGIHCATVTINGVLGTPGFEPERIADVYAEVAAEPRDSWRTVIPFPL